MQKQKCRSLTAETSVRKQIRRAALLHIVPAERVGGGGRSHGRAWGAARVSDGTKLGGGKKQISK